MASLLAYDSREKPVSDTFWLWLNKNLTNLNPVFNTILSGSGRVLQRRSRFKSTIREIERLEFWRHRRNPGMMNWKIWNMKLQSFWKNSEYFYPPLNDIPPPALLIAAIRGHTKERINEPVSKFEPWKASFCPGTYVQLNKSNLSHKRIFLNPVDFTNLIDAIITGA